MSFEEYCALDPKIYCEIAGGKYDLIFGTPESWLITLPVKKYKR